MSIAPAYIVYTAKGVAYGRDSDELKQHEFLKQLISSLPYITAILNEERKIIISNQVLINDEKVLTIEEFFGKEPGEPLNCLHARKSVNICEGKGICKYCGLPNVILRAENSGKLETQETTITINSPETKSQTFDIRVTAGTLIYNNQKHLFLTVMDLSAEKRKRALERIFFHDILNKTGSLEGIYELLQNNVEPEKNKELIELSGEIIKDLSEEIILQKNLVAAESGDLEIKPDRVRTTELIEESINQVIQYPASQNIQIHLSPDTVDYSFVTDPIILKRILINMLKNGVEASPNHQQVTIGAKESSDNLVFWVHSYSFIPPEMRIKIFERTFSTKSSDRGLGTYSMKLLGEKYLGGKVHFTTGKKEGTTFYFDIPLINRKEAT